MSGGHGHAEEAHGHGGGGGLDFIGNTFFEGFGKTAVAGVQQMFSGLVNSVLSLFGGGSGGGGHHDHGHH